MSDPHFEADPPARFSDDSRLGSDQGDPTQQIPRAGERGLEAGASGRRTDSTVGHPDGERTSDIWLPDDALADQLPAARNAGLPGPGLPEAIGWTFGCFVLQIIAGLGVFALLAMYAVVQSLGLESISPETIESALSDIMSPAGKLKLQEDNLSLFVAGTMLICIPVTIFAVRLRLGKEAPRLLSLARPSLPHVVLLAALFLPMTIVSNEIYRRSMLAWDALLKLQPELTRFEIPNTNDIVPMLVAQTPLTWVVLALGLGPALWEELLFRGIIGRGLTARWGMIAGVLLTSLFFAVVHMHPAHAAGVLSLGIVMHVIYLATRSIWAPMLYHFMNNTYGVLATKWAYDAGQDIHIESEGPGILLLLTASLSAVVSLALLWSMRTRFQLPGGVEWSPGHATAERPPAHLNCESRYRRPHALHVSLAVLCCAAFAAAFWFTPDAAPDARNTTQHTVSADSEQGSSSTFVH